MCVCVYLQLITFNDGKVGVNFFGYHAEAGLGGGQSSSNGLLGGLHASAGTPWGQNAAAGLGGSVNGKFFFIENQSFEFPEENYINIIPIRITSAN